MVEILSVSAVTAAYAMDAAKPARRISALDKVRDAKLEAERNEVRKTGGSLDDIPALIPAVTVSLDPTAGKQFERHTPEDYAARAYEED